MNKSDIGFPLELSGDAEYHPGYFFMSLPFRLKESIKDLSRVEAGTFLHEYTHYLQNVSTLWGLYENVYLYADIDTVIEKVVNDDYPILDVPLSEEYIRKDEFTRKKIALGRGSDRTSNGYNVSGLKLAEKPNFTYEMDFPLDRKKLQRVLISFDTVSHGSQTIMFGAWYIKEAMAAIIQRRVDPTADNRHNDLPYKLVERFVAELFPTVHADEDKLLAFCYLSLFSQFPGMKFIELCIEEFLPPECTAEQYVENFFNIPAKCSFGNVDYGTLLKHYHDSIIKIISHLLGGEPEYLPKVIDEDLGSSRLWKLIITNDIDPVSLDQMVQSFGMPIIIGAEGYGLFPGITSMFDCSEIFILMGYGNCYKYLVNGFCPQINQCNTIEGMVSHHCQSTPWNREGDCPMKFMATELGLTSKNIINHHRPDLM